MKCFAHAAPTTALSASKKPSARLHLPDRWLRAPWAWLCDTFQPVMAERSGLVTLPNLITTLTSSVR